MANPPALEPTINHNGVDILEFLPHGGSDVLSVEQARKLHEHAVAEGVDVTFVLVDEEQTGAEHCQHDNPTLGQELMADWLADVFGIDQRALLDRGQQGHGER